MKIKAGWKRIILFALVLAAALMLGAGSAVAEWISYDDRYDEWDAATGTLTIKNDAPGDGYYTGEEVANVRHLVIDFGISSSEAFVRDFSAWTNLESITFNGAANLVNSAFTNCTGLKTLTFEGSAWINKASFSGCTNLETLTFGDEALIDEEAFKDHKKLQRLEFNGNTETGNKSFKDCSRLETVAFKKEANVETDAFGNCTALKTVTFPDTAD